MDIEPDDDGLCVVNCTTPCKGHGLVHTVSFALASDQMVEVARGVVYIIINDLTSDYG